VVEKRETGRNGKRLKERTTGARFKKKVWEEKRFGCVLRETKRERTQKERGSGVHCGVIKPKSDLNGERRKTGRFRGVL